MPITQQQIARHLGVDQKTVSIAFGASGRISAETRERILTTARQLGYRPNRLAAGLRGATTRSVGVIWPFIDRWAGDDAIGLEVLRLLQARGFATYQTQPSYDEKVFNQQVDDLLERRVDAIVIQATPPRLRNGELAQRLRDCPAVIAVSREDISDFTGDIVIHDRYQAIEQVVNHLARTGRKRPAMITSMSEESNPPKFEIFKRQCEKHGLANHPNLLIDMEHPDNPESHGQLHLDAIRRQFPGKIDVDAIFSFNDIGALCIMRELQDRGLSIPRDIAVIGFNNIDAARIWRPPLATGDRMYTQVAETVDQLLQARLEDPSLPPQRKTVHMQFIWRESAGP